MLEIRFQVHLMINSNLYFGILIALLDKLVGLVKNTTKILCCVCVKQGQKITVWNPLNYLEQYYRHRAHIISSRMRYNEYPVTFTSINNITSCCGNAVNYVQKKKKNTQCSFIINLIIS